MLRENVYSVHKHRRKHKSRISPAAIVMNVYRPCAAPGSGLPAAKTAGQSLFLRDITIFLHPLGGKRYKILPASPPIGLYVVYHANITPQRKAPLNLQDARAMDWDEPFTKNPAKEKKPDFSGFKIVYIG